MCLVCQKYDLLTIAYIALHQFEVSCIYSKKRPNQISKFQIFSSLRMSQIQNDLKGYRHQPSQSRVDIEHWLKANTA